MKKVDTYIQVVVILAMFVLGFMVLPSLYIKTTTLEWCFILFIYYNTIIYRFIMYLIYIGYWNISRKRPT